MAEVAVDCLLRKLEDRILLESNKRKASELNHVKLEFEKVRPFLKNADWRKMVAADNGIAKWVSDVINLAYEVEDVIDNDYNRRKENGLSLSSLVEFVSESFSYKTTSIKPRMSDKLFPTRVLEKLMELEVRRKHLTLYGDIREARRERLVRHSKSFFHKLSLNNMVGRSKEFMILKELLVNDVEAGRPALIAITGMAGVGKTTLAVTVYEHMQRHFECSAWIFVYGQSVTGILRDMVTSFSRSYSGMKPVTDLDKLADKDLANMIHGYLGSKKFLLVLDGLDTINTLEDIRCALPSQCRGKVVMTSCSTAFPEVICKHVLHLEPLMTGDDLDLFHRQALLQQYDDGDVPLSSSMKSMEKKILDICEGLPLAIATMGGMLSTINLQEHGNWNEVLHMLEEVNEHWPHSDLIMKIVTVCYFSLPSMLKCCLRYCGMFPLHCEIQCKRLIRLWVAEGFIPRQLLGMTEEEAAKCLLDEILQRNLLEVVQVGINGEVVSCRLLQPVQSFLFEMSKKDQLFVLSESSKEFWSSNASRFVTIHGKINNETPNLIPKEIRSLHVFEGRQLKTPILLDSISRIKHIHVLDLRNIPIETLPEEIGELVQLHYLDLRSTRLHELPSSLINLHELQTFDIRNTPIRILPCGFDGVKMLRHLLLAGSHGNRVVKFDADIMFLKDLQTLAGVKLTRNVALGLNHLPKLLKLSVGEVEGGKNSLLLCESINQMKHLNSLTIKCAWRKEIQIQISNPLDNLEKLRVGGWVRDLMQWISRLHSLKYLHLWDCMLSQDPISTLQHLPNLVVLSLCKAYMGKQICCNNRTGFPKLKRLSILRFEELTEWTNIEEGAMEKLQILTIAQCRKLKLPPKGLESLKDLEMLQIAGMTTEFVERAKEISLSSSSDFSVCPGSAVST